jgi:soluble lytic murein transglycosylase-like protein
VRVRRVLPVLAALMSIAAPAQAAAPHTVQPGETLWSIAAANNLTTRTVAAYNGLSENSQVVLGSTIMVPTTVEGYAKLQQAGLVPATPAAPAAPAAAQPASSGAASSTGAAPSTAAPGAQGAYTVRPGDTLSGLAAVARVSPSDIAAMNGLSLESPLLAGTLIKLPAGSPTPPRAAEPAPATRVVPAAAPAATPARLSATDVQSVAAQYGVSPSLAAAIAWQESGFNNGMVSGANARGVMQVMPGTWDYVQRNLTQRQLDPSSPVDNVHAGVLYLKRLLADSGGDENTAIAGYYQGLGSVRSRGQFDDTRRYVANVQALRSRFGGG